MNLDKLCSCGIDPTNYVYSEDYGDNDSMIGAAGGDDNSIQFDEDIRRMNKETNARKEAYLYGVDESSMLTGSSRTEIDYSDHTIGTRKMQDDDSPREKAPASPIKKTLTKESPPQISPSNTYTTASLSYYDDDSSDEELEDLIAEFEESTVSTDIASNQQRRQLPEELQPTSRRTTYPRRNSSLFRPRNDSLTSTKSVIGVDDGEEGKYRNLIRMKPQNYYNFKDPWGGEPSFRYLSPVVSPQTQDRKTCNNDANDTRTIFLPQLSS